MKKFTLDEIDALFADVATTLAALLDAGARPGNVPTDWPEYHGQRYGRALYAEIPEPQGGALGEALSRLPILATATELVMWVGNSGTAVGLNELVRWLVVATHDAGGVDQPLSALRDLLVTNSVTASEFVDIWGITVEAPTRIGPDQWVLPVGDASDVTIAGHRLVPTA